jgi:long-chain acyl-CoA synthetase
MIDFVAKYDQEKLGIAKHAKRTPEKPALIVNDAVVTYEELDRKSNALANGLLKLGINPGDRICMLMPNGAEILLGWTAAGKLAITPIALNYHFKQDEVSYIINDSKSKLLIFAEEFREVVDGVMKKITLSPFTFISAEAVSTPQVLDLSEIIAESPETPPQVEADSIHMPSALIYTAGTTGRPKGVYKKSKGRLNALLGCAYNFESTYDDIHLVAGPLYHAAPYAWAALSLLLGNTLVIMPKFDSEEFLHLIEKYRVTTTFVVPTMLNRIVHLPAHIKQHYDISSLRVMVTGGEAFPFPLKQEVISYFERCRLFEFYGGTETSVITCLRPEEQLRRPGSCGNAVMGADIKLLDENKQPVGVEDIGILYVKSPFLMDGYYNNPAANEACYHGDYLTVGDMAKRDEDGYYYIVDRAVDVVISGGVNIYPAEIEAVLHEHPGVFDAAIIGAKDPDWGEKVVAYVVPEEGWKITKEDIMEYVAGKLASYKKPSEVIFLREIPYSPSGKQLKRLLREDYSGRCGIKQ